MCGTGWTISQEFITRPLYFRVKYIYAYLTADWAAFSRFKFSSEQWLVASRSWLTDQESLAQRV